jgi:hypothetical protein
MLTLVIHKVVELNPSSHVGYQLKHTALLGAQRYDDAIAAIEIMLLKLNSAPDAQIRSKSQVSHASRYLTFFSELHQQYVTRSRAEGVIRQVINVQLDFVYSIPLLDSYVTEKRRETHSKQAQSTRSFCYRL